MYVLRWELERRQANLLPPPGGVLMEVLPGQLLLRARCSTQLRRLRGPTGWTQGIFLPTRPSMSWSTSAGTGERTYFGGCHTSQARELRNRFVVAGFAI